MKLSNCEMEGVLGGGTTNGSFSQIELCIIHSGVCFPQHTILCKLWNVFRMSGASVVEHKHEII